MQEPRAEELGSAQGHNQLEGPGKAKEPLRTQSLHRDKNDVYVIIVFLL